MEVVALGLTGFPPVREVAEELAARIAEQLDADEVRLTQDMVTAHAGALADGYGVVVAAGTGLVCLAVDRDGSWHKVDGHGYLFGDAGSAFAIGRAGLVAVQRARDGRGPATKLAETTLEPVTLYRSADAGGRRRTLRSGGTALCRRRRPGCGTTSSYGLLGTSPRRSVLPSATLAGRRAVPVACVGGLFAGAGEQLLDPVRAALSSRARLVAAAGNSLDGAERLATGPPGPYADLIVTHRRS